MVKYWIKSTTAQLMLLILSSIAISFFPLASCANMENQDGMMVENGNNGNGSDLSCEESKVADQKVCHFDRLSIELLNRIGSYLTNPVTSIGFLNKKFYHIFHDYFPVGYYVNERFNIEEFKTVDKNEKELNSILNSTWCRNEPLVLFKSLLKDFISMKKNYQALVIPYHSYLSSTYYSLSANERLEIDQFSEQKTLIAPFDSALSRVCGNYGNLRLAFELLSGNRSNLFEYISNAKNKILLFEFFKSNPDRAYHYMIQISAKISIGDDIPGYYTAGSWITDCIIYDAPPKFYIDLLYYRPTTWNYSIRPLFFSHEITESEYSRIYSQVSEIINTILIDLVSNTDTDFYNLLNSVRFGPENSLQVEFAHYSEERLKSIAQAALLANKRELFLETYNLYKQRVRSSNNDIRDDEILSGFINTRESDDMNYFQSKNVRMIFEIMASDANTLFATQDHLNDFFLVNALLNSYAAKHLHREGDKITLVFAALDNLIDLGFPPEIRIDINDYDHASEIVYCIFSYTKVFTEETMSSFLNDYISNFMFGKSFSVSFETVELTSNSPLLIEKLKSFEIKLTLYSDVETFGKYFDLPNFENVSQIVEVWCSEPKFKKEEHFRKFEMLKSKTIAEIFLKWESEKFLFNSEFSEFDYLDWRHALAYWIKGDQRERIKEIRSPAIIKMLRIEFPEEMDQILVTEVIKNSLETGL